MNLVIQITDGKTVNHPIAEENLRVLIPDLDINNPPPGYARFVRKPCPELSMYQRLDPVEYVLDLDLSEELKTPVWTDKYNIRDLTEEELIEIAADSVRTQNEKMQMDLGAPSSAPDDGNLYIWSEPLSKWILLPDNFDQVVKEFTKKVNELGLSNITPEDYVKLSDDKKQTLQEIVNKIDIIDDINTIEEYKV